MSDDSEDVGPSAAKIPFGMGMTQFYDIQISGSVGHLGEPGWGAAFSTPKAAFHPDTAATGNSGLAHRVNDIPVEVEAVIGRVKVSVARLMGLSEGQQLQLDRRFGEPVELRVNGRVFGYGEIVAGEHDNVIGIRMTRLAG